MSEVHLLTDLLIVALYESITYGEYAVFLAKNEGGTLNILCAYVIYWLQLFELFILAILAASRLLNCRVAIAFT